MSRKEDPTDRSADVPLTAGETLALRRVAEGVAQPLPASSADLRQLQKLRLIEEVGGVLRLTVIGRDLYAQLRLG